MGFLESIRLRKKSATPVDEATAVSTQLSNIELERRLEVMARKITATPYVANANFVALYNSVPEVQWPINYIATRCAGAKYMLKRYEDDTVVWDNEFANKLLVQPNAFETWYRTIFKHFAYKLLTGNSYIKAAMSDAFAGAQVLYEWCDRYVTLEAPYVHIKYQRFISDIYGVADVEDVVKYYTHDIDSYYRNKPIDPRCVFHDKDDVLGYITNDPLKAKSRLYAALKAISNLIAVYEARNVIYVKRGALGWLVSDQKDEMGSKALTKDEKKQILEETDKMYGVGEGQYPYGISDVKLQFIRTNLSITELEPFEETLADAIIIAGLYGIPGVLVPRKDMAKYENMKSAEKSVYTSVIVPMVQRFCQEFTRFLGLDQDGLYLDADFSDVDCLQSGRKEEQEVHRSITDRCKIEFESALITLNDWRAQQGYERVEDPLYDKLISEMTPDEIERVKNYINQTPKQDEGEFSAPSVQNEGE